jgi:hypothetical protein
MWVFRYINIKGQRATKFALNALYFYIIGIQENKDMISKVEKRRQANKSYYQRNKLLPVGNNENSLFYN